MVRILAGLSVASFTLGTVMIGGVGNGLITLGFGIAICAYIEMFNRILK